MENANYTGPSPPPDKENDDTEKKPKISSDLQEQLQEKEEGAAFGEEEDETKMALSDDPTKVKFTNSLNHELNDGNQGNGEAKVEIENVQLAFAGMGKDELMAYADDPFWVRLRWTLFILFWALWVAMLVGAVAIVVSTPGCPPLPARDWWQKGAVYHVYLKSFKDSNGDGIGDLPGLTSKLDYLQELGINTILLSPHYKSPMYDTGYDISDFIDVDPMYGNLSDFKELVKGVHDRGMYIVLDFVPNHSSADHPWFKASRERAENYTDYYIWQAGTPDKPPNNWLSVFGHSAWKYDPVRKEYYLHQFLESQPDLNLRNPAVREEMKNILKFWLDLGADGFRVDALKHCFEDEELRDEPVKQLDKDSTLPPYHYDTLEHIYTTLLPEALDILSEWREVLDSYKEKDGKHRFLTVEVYDDLERVMAYYGNDSSPLADFPMNFELVGVNSNSSAVDILRRIYNWTMAIPEGRWTSWILGNHDNHRVASRIHQELVDGLHMISTLLAGTPITYYGEEIGMQDVFVPYSLTQDWAGKVHGEKDYEKYTRDFERTPMQWSGVPNAGFTNASVPWLPVSPNFTVHNVEVQQSDPDSHLSIFKRLLKLRSEPAIVYGEQHLLPLQDEVFSFARVKKGSPGYVVVVNFGTNMTQVKLTKLGCCRTFDFPEDGLVELKSRNISPESKIATAGNKIRISLDEIELSSNEAVIMKFVPQFKSE